MLARTAPRCILEHLTRTQKVNALLRVKQRLNQGTCGYQFYSHDSSASLPKKTAVDELKAELVAEDKNVKPVLKEITDVAHTDEEQDSPLEREYKKQALSFYRTSYGREMDEEKPEDEEGMLQYYVKKAQDSMDEINEAEYYDIVGAERRLFFRMVDLWIQDAGEARRGHREFLQVAMNNVDRFNVQHEPKAYLKIMECYPQSKHTGMRREKWFKAVFQDKILDHELAVRLFGVMQKYRAPANDEFFNTCMRLFGPYSRATAKVRQMIFWGPRLNSFRPFEADANKISLMNPVEIAFRGLRQASPSLDAVYERFEVDKSSLEEQELELPKKGLDCIISLQTKEQRELLKEHDVTKPVYVEGPHMLYYRNEKVQYYVMRADPVAAETKVTPTSWILTSKEWWSDFYKTDIKSMKRLGDTGEIYTEESFLPTVHFDEGISFSERAPSEIRQIANDTKDVEGRIYAIASMDYKSPNALKSWLTGLQPNNPILTQLTVVFSKKQSFLSEGGRVKPSDRKDS